MTIRQEAFLQNSQGTVVDKFGVWLSSLADPPACPHLRRQADR